MLDDDDRGAGVDQPVEQPDQGVHVVHVQARGGLVEHIDIALLAQFGGELEPLALAARQGGERLSQGQIAQAHVVEPLQDLGDGRLGEEVHRVRNAHLIDVADGSAAQPVLQHFGQEALALAGLAGGGHGIEMGEVGIDDPQAVAVRARPLGIGGEQPGVDRVGLGEGLAHIVENARVGRHVGPSRAARQVLIDDDGFRIGLGQAALDQGRLARAGDA